MNLYQKMNTEQRNLLKEAGVVLEDKNYSEDEVRQLENTVTTHIFSQSKKIIGKETDKYMGILQLMELENRMYK